MLTLDAPGSAALDSLIAELRPALVVIDPITAYLGGTLDIHRANEVRQWMQRLAAISERARAVTLLVRHLRKESPRKGSNPIYRGLGSIDFAAAVRSVMMVHQVEDYPSLKCLRHIKSNLGPRGPALHYTVDERGFRWCDSGGE